MGAALGEHRVVTLTGPGGVGKTRTALEVARRLRRLPDGVAVELPPRCRRRRFAGGRRRRDGSRRGTQRRDVDHRVDPRSHRRVADAPGARQLRTRHRRRCSTRERRGPRAGRRGARLEPRTVGVAGERVVAVPPMSTADGVTLFCEAAAADDTVHFDDDDLAAVAEICARLDDCRWRSSSQRPGPDR
ncbi:MAG: hypothetical protein R2713_23695 [Ilumatobacteraceae bacterium]